MNAIRWLSHSSKNTGLAWIKPTQDVASAWLCYLVIAALSAALWLGLVAIYLAARPLT